MAKVLRLLVGIWVFAFFGAVFLVVLLVGSAAMLVMQLWALITGKRPVAIVQFYDVWRATKEFSSGNWPSRPGRHVEGDANVVDVQAHEVTSVPDEGQI